MTNFILLIVLIIVSYLVFFFEIERHEFIFSNSSIVNNGILNQFEKNKFKVYNNASLKQTKIQINEFNINTAQTSKLNTANPSHFIDKKIINANKELSDNLNLLEYIMAVESPLVNLASNDKCTSARLEEYLEVKRDVQLKIIELSQSIAYFQSQKVNLC